MIVKYCDFCGKPIKTVLDLCTVMVEPEIRRVGFAESEYHLHTECFVRLENKVRLFTSEKGGAE